MRNRLRKVTNFFAFNLLFFALYLNFIHKDNNALDTAEAYRTSAPEGSSLKQVRAVESTTSYNQISPVQASLVNR